MKYFDTEKGPFALGDITQVPNHQEMMKNQIIAHGEAHDDSDGWMSQLSKNQFVKQYLKRGIA